MMRDALLARRHVVDTALAVALGYALFRALDAITDFTLDIVGQQVDVTPAFAGAGRSVAELLRLFAAGSGPSLLSFTIGDTVVPYGLVVGGLSTLALVLLTGALIRCVQRRCPHCRSPVPKDATVCAACSLELA